MQLAMTSAPHSSPGIGPPAVVGVETFAVVWAAGAAVALVGLVCAAAPHRSLQTWCGVCWTSVERGRQVELPSRAYACMCMCAHRCTGSTRSRDLRPQTAAYHATISVTRSTEPSVRPMGSWTHAVSRQAQAFVLQGNKGA